MHPLKDALTAAQRRRDEAAGIREALEAEAQEVAQMAVEAETNLKEAQRQLEEANLSLADAKQEASALQAQLSETQAKLRIVKEELSSVDIVASRDYTDAPAVEEPERIRDDEIVDAPSTESLEDELWSRTQELEQALERVSKVESQIAAIELKVAAAQEVYTKADEIAAAAMETAEEAVRDEMECITVFNETEQALLKAIEDLRFLDDSSERREEEFDKKSKASQAASPPETSVSQEASLASSVTGATSAAQQSKVPAAKTEKTNVQLSVESTEKEKVKSSTAVVPGAIDEESRLMSTPSFRRRFLHTLVWLNKNRAMVVIGAFAVALSVAVLHYSGAYNIISNKLSILAETAHKWWDVITGLVSRLPFPHIHKSEEGLLETIWLLLASVLTVPLVCKLPGGSPVLGFLASGALIGPYALGIIQDVESIRHLAELGVVFLLFNIGLELSFDRLRSMQKFVFGMGTGQVVVTLAAVAYTSLLALGGSLGGPGSIILGGGLALSTTAVGMQVLQDRGETGSRHGRAAFSVLLLQDLAVVVLLMLIPLLAPSPEGASSAGLSRIAKAIGFASIKAVVCMASIIVVGRTVLQPLYRRVADTNNADVFAALTLLVVLGTSLLTQVAGLSLALGAFLAGLLLAETEFHIQVESDIAPYKGLLMGLFFMTVGMEISISLLFAKWKTVLAAITLLITGKVAIMGAVGRAFGLSLVQSLRAGLLLSPGGEFAFVLFGEAVSRGIMGANLAKELYLVVALSMALTPFLADFGARIGRLLERNDMKTLSPKEGEMSGMSNHVIIAGFGRVGQLIAQMLSEELIPFVALDTSASRVQEGKSQDLPVYFGDAGSPAVLHSIGADRAACAVITLDSPGSNYRSVWAMHKHFPHVKTFCRAHDINTGVMLERAGATAVVPEVLEPSLQLGAAVLSELSVPEDDVAETIRAFRKNHLAELQALAMASGSSLGYGEGRTKGENKGSSMSSGKGTEEADKADENLSSRGSPSMA